MFDEHDRLDSLFSTPFDRKTLVKRTALAGAALEPLDTD